MKVLITGNYGLGKSIGDILIGDNYEVSIVDSADLRTYFLPDVMDKFDVFVNNEYKHKLQTPLFNLFYESWRYKKKTIVNILTSALVFGSPNKEYIELKKELEDLSYNLRTEDKEVRVINIYPNTLESSKTAPYSKLRFEEVAKLIAYTINLPHDIEIFKLGISKTKLKISNSII
jgi:hypothetical protein